MLEIGHARPACLMLMELSAPPTPIQLPVPIQHIGGPTCMLLSSSSTLCRPLTWLTAASSSYVQDSSPWPSKILFAEVGSRIINDDAFDEKLSASKSYAELTISPEQAFLLPVESLQHTSSSVLLEVQRQTGMIALRDSSPRCPSKCLAVCPRQCCCGDKLTPSPRWQCETASETYRRTCPSTMPLRDNRQFPCYCDWKSTSLLQVEYTHHPRIPRPK